MKNTEKRIVVIRTSSMGDVALTVPVIRAMREQYPDTLITMVTRKTFIPFFSPLEGLILFEADFSGNHRGIRGLFRMYREIKASGDIDCLIDLHDVARSRLLRFLFRLSGVPVSVIDKGRKAKRALVKGKTRSRLTHTVERYKEAFYNAGFTITLSPGPWIIPSAESMASVEKKAAITSGLNIGVAPFSKHELKRWPEEYLIELAGMISERRPVTFWLFGGAEDSDKIAWFYEKVPGSKYLSGGLSLDEELALISRLDFMISMDSANMHMAALTGTRVISIWGATDPAAGFGAWMQPDEYSVSISSGLECRPCTVYGRGRCKRKDHACMKWLTPEMVYERITDLKLL